MSFASGSTAGRSCDGIRTVRGYLDRVGHRARWLARPWFFIAVALLVLNDQVLKSAWPGWTTGKLSDFAGLFVVATLFSILGGPFWGAVLAGAAFVLLKTVPGVAELVSPLMGGVTRRDASDLLALVVLPLVCGILSRELRGQAKRFDKGWRLAGLIAAVAATSATSAPYDDFVDWVSFDGSGVLALVRLDNYQTPVYLRSRDDGQTWAEEAKYIIQDPEPVDTFGEVCATEGICYRYNKMNSRVLERREIGAKKWRAVATFDSSVGEIFVDPTDGDRAALVQQEEEVLVRTPAGTWQGANLVVLARQLRPKPDPWAGPRSAVQVVGGLVLGFVALIGILTGVQRLRTRWQRSRGLRRLR